MSSNIDSLDGKLYTSRYSAAFEIDESGLAPVGITISPPRFKLPYELVATLGPLAPHGLMGREPEDFLRGYESKLDSLGANRMSMLPPLMRCSGDDRPVFARRSRESVSTARFESGDLLWAPRRGDALLAASPRS